MAWFGGCFCGAVRYEAVGEIVNATTCHCPTCRRVSGAPAVSWFTVARDNFRSLQGSPAELHSSNAVTRTFCSVCGTPLTYRMADTSNEVDITLCSLDRPDELAPLDHTYTRFRVKWNIIGDMLPCYAASRTESGTDHSGSNET